MPKKRNKNKGLNREQLDWSRRLAAETAVDLTPEDLEDLELAAMQEELDAIPFAEDLAPEDWSAAEETWNGAMAAIERGDFDAAREGIDNLRRQALGCLTKEADAITYAPDIAGKDQAEASRRRQLATAATEGQDMGAARRAVDALREHAVAVSKTESEAHKRCKDLMSTVGDLLETVRDKLPHQLASPGALLARYRVLLKELSENKGTGGLEDRIKAFQTAVTAFSAAYDGHLVDVAMAVDPRFAALPALQQAFGTAKDAAAAVDAAAFQAAVDEVARIASVLGPAQMQWDALWGQVDAVHRNTQACFVEVNKISSGASEAAEAVKKLLMQGAPALELAGLMDGRAVTGLRDWLETRRDWADRTEAALSEPEFRSDLASAFNVSAKGVGPAREAVMRALCALDGTAGAIDTAYEEMLKVKGPWSERLKREAKARPGIEALEQLGAAPAVARKLGIAALTAKVDAADLVRSSGVAVAPTLADLIGKKGAVRTLQLLRAIGNEAGLRRYLDNSEVTPANLAVLAAAGDLVMTRQNRLIPYRGCHRHTGRDEVEAAVDVQWRYLGVDAAWGVIHVHYCSGAANLPPLRTTNAASASFYHVKANGNFGGSGGPVVNAGLRGQIDAVIGLQTL